MRTFVRDRLIEEGVCSSLSGCNSDPFWFSKRIWISDRNGKSPALSTYNTRHHIMSIFDYDNYDLDYQRYLDWKHEQEEEDRYYDGQDLAAEYEYDLLREQAVEERRASEYVADQEQETTGQRVVREALSLIPEEEDMRQLAQITVNGIYVYELYWLPDSHEILVELDSFRDGSPMYYRYPDTMGTMEVLSQLLGMPKERLSITELAFFTPERVIDDLFDIERQQFVQGVWLDYAGDGWTMQFNVNSSEEETPVECKDCFDAACNGTNCEFKPQLRPHGIDGTQCDCMECEEQNAAE